jgi:hypothetical protein
MPSIYLCHPPLLSINPPTSKPVVSTIWPTYFWSTQNYIPISTHNALIESGIVSTDVRSSFFKVTSLVGLGFCDHTGSPITSVAVSNDLATRLPGLSYFAFRSTVSPTYINLRLTEVTIFTARICLALPQSTYPLAISKLPLNRNLFGGTNLPSLPNHPEKIITHAAITAKL